MEFAEQIIVVESSAIHAGAEVEHIKLIVGGSSGVMFNLSLSQARSLAKSLVQQVHRLEVAGSMRRTKLQQTGAIQSNLKRTIGAGAPQAA